MSTVFKVFISAISFIFVAIAGASVTQGFGDTTIASDYLEKTSRIIVESNYNEDVILECCEDAKEHGYEMTVEVKGGNRSGQKRYMEIEFKYDFNIRLFDFSTQRTRIKVL